MTERRGSSATRSEVKKTWQFAELHGCWWAYEGELPPPEAFQTHGRRPETPILGPYPSRVIAEAMLRKPQRGATTMASACRPWAISVETSCRSYPLHASGYGPGVICPPSSSMRFVPHGRLKPRQQVSRFRFCAMPIAPFGPEHSGMRRRQCAPSCFRVRIGG